MADTYCKNLSNTYRFEFHNDELLFAPCASLGEKCAARDVATIQNFRKQAAAQVHANKRHRCYQCYFVEENEKRISERHTASEYVPDDALDEVPYILDFQISRHCNAACAHCGPYHSSMWKKIKDLPVTIKNFTHQYDQALAMVSLDKVKLVKFNGGEPFLGNEHLVVLAKLSPENVTVYYETNGSIEITEDIISVWSKFKRVMVSVSVDAVGKRFEFLRWPLSWEVITKNIEELIGVLPNLEMQINCTVHPLNAFYISELEEWLAAVNHNHGTNIAIEYRPCSNDWATSATPQSLVNAIKEKYPGHAMCNVYKNRISQRPHLDRFLAHAEMVDKQRGMSWRSVFPDIAEYFD